MALDPSQFIVAGLAVMLGAPVAGAVLAFLPDARVRRIGRILLVTGFFACAAAVIGCIRLSGRQSAGIGNQIFLVIAIVPAVLALIWFFIWRAARRHDDVQSLPPEVRRVEELADIEKAIEQARRELHRTEQRLGGLSISSDERSRLRNQTALLEATIQRLEIERAKRAM